MSWRKAALSARVTWLGWSFDFEHFVVQLDPSKLDRLLSLLRQVLSSAKCTVTLLEKLTGKLLWLSNLFSSLRPSLAPLYIDQRNPVPNMCAVSPEVWASLRASLSPDLRVTRPLPLAAIPVGCKLLRFAHTGFRLKLPRSIAVPPGKCWCRLGFCGLCPSSFHLGMPPFT